MEIHTGEIPDFRPGKPTKYPWQTLEVGEYFILPVGRYSGPPMARAASDRYAPKVFKTKYQDGELRCWRVK